MPPKRLQASQHAKSIDRNDDEQPKSLDPSTLPTSTLLKYVQVHNLKIRSDRREDLVAAVSRHYAAQEVQEKDVVTYFMYNVKHIDEVLKLPASTAISTIQTSTNQDSTS